jgi:RHH-type proline utilization regulon transcriptional repressor/proline dehydrogenase/delta 1-pyrroline-5-carboxylate dehydrogenase
MTRVASSSPPPQFVNEPVSELRRAPERAYLLAALDELDARLPLRVPVIIGEGARDEPSFESVDPSSPSLVVGRVTAATHAEVDLAVRTAASAQREWGATPVEQRAAILARAAGELRRRRASLAALAVRECAKPWSQADADVCEAIDFLEYYGRQAVALEAPSELVQMPGERNTLYRRARGVVAVISPWNFPFAIATGMTAAGLATGNAVCLKPAEQSPACALAVVEALRTAGVPDGVLALLPGDGDVGAALVESGGVHTIAFTGSSPVGLEIRRKAAIQAEGQRHLKRVVAEMGGKNCVIVDADADLDEVIPALLDSAFAFAGQKCSAASRVLVHGRVYGALLDRLHGALDTLCIGPADAFATDVPPVIDEAAGERVERAISELGPEADVRRVTEIPSGEGYWVAPTIVTGAPPDSQVITSELFGPVLAVEPVASVDAACDLVDGQSQALTGGLFSRDPQTIARVIGRVPVGNFYVNRATTGAMAGRQPFGGNRLSGTGAKAGGPEYLLNFVESVVVTENTVRHGLPIE